MFIGWVSCFLYWNEGSKLTKFYFNSIEGFGTFDFHGNYQVVEAFLGSLWLYIASWDTGTKMRQGLINKLDIINIHIDYLMEIESHEILW